MGKKIVADLHIHTTFSDGSKTPDEIVRYAKRQHLEAIAISDHDTFGGIDPAKQESNGKITVIPAVELSTKFEGYDLHVLGYFVDYKDSQLVHEVSRFRAARATRAKKIVDNLNDMGVSVDFNRIKHFSAGGAIGRPHIAKALVDTGYVIDESEAFTEYIGYDSPAYVPKYKIHPFEAIKLIKAAGGIPVWAHPGSLGTQDLVQVFVENGLMGIEIYHPNHHFYDRQRFEKLARKYGLLVTGGTDYHGRDTDNEVGTVGINKAQLEQLKAAANKII